MALQKIDLTTGYPSSVRTELFGIVQLQRTIDKGIALAQGTVGEYHYNCPMDQAVFEYLGIDHEQLLEVIKKANDAGEIESYVKPFVAKKSATELAQWNEEWLQDAPDAGSDGAKYLRSMVEAKDPSRTDITTWADMLDLDEGREVPQRAAA